MHATLLTILHAATSPATTAAAKKSKSSGSNYVFLLVIAAFGAFYFFVLRPRSQRARQQQQTTKKDLSVGDEVVSIGGIVGTVVGFDGDDVEVEVDEGVVLTFIRRAVNLKQAPGAAPAPRPSLFGRPPRPTPPPADDEFDDDDDDDSPAVTGIDDEPSHGKDTPGGGPDSPPAGR